MCGDCWNAAMGAPAMAVAARFAWIGYKDRIPFLGRKTDEATADRCQAPVGGEAPAPVVEAEPVEPGRELVEVGPSPPR